MKLMHLDKWGFGVVAAVLVLAVVACEGTGSIKGETEFLGAGGSIDISWNNSSATVDRTRGDARVDIVFRDAQGNEIAGSGGQGVGPGQSVAVPSGATTMTVSGPSNSTTCTGCTGGGGMAQGDDFTLDQSSDVKTPVQKWMVLFALDADMDVNAPEYGPLSNTVASFDFLVLPATTASQLFGLIAPIVIADMGNQPAVPSYVTVNFFSRMVPDPSGLGAGIFVADRTAEFQSFAFSLDGVTRATLGWNSVVRTAPFGWQVIETRVNANDLIFTNGGNSGAHSFTIEADTLEGDNEGYAGSLAYW